MFLLRPVGYVKAINQQSSPSLVFAWGGGTVQVPEEYRDALCMMIHSLEAEFYLLKSHYGRL